MRLFSYLFGLVAAVLFPLPLVLLAAALLATDLGFRLFGKRQPVQNSPVRRDAVSIVIPTWNGLDLLQKYLPPLIDSLGANPAHEVIVVDNASVDGTVEYLHAHFPRATVLAQKTNLGFGGGSNAGFRAAKHDIVVLLNNDMRVAKDFLAPLLEPFADPAVFAVACQIFLSDPEKRREETGLTETWWGGGRLVASHRNDPAVDRPFPCGYPGGGSSAFDRRKFLELGGFSEVFRPFYYEDTDLGIAAWKRGWKVFYQPRSIVFHEHRGTIGKKFRREYIESVVRTNLLVYSWKNMHDWRLLGAGFAHTFAVGLVGAAFGRKQGQFTVRAVWHALGRLPELLRARWRARALAVLSEREAFRRQKGGYFWDRFGAFEAAPNRLQVLFVSPYHIEPPTHGGAVFMRQTIHELSRHADVHVLTMVDAEEQVAPHEALRKYCASLTVMVRKEMRYRMPLGKEPRVEIEFADRDFEWAMHRIMLLKGIDVVQIEYPMLAQYWCGYHRIPQFLFEHDIAFQAIGREFRLRKKVKYLFSYMQLMHMELERTRRFSRVQVCSAENGRYLVEFAPQLAGRVDAHTRAAIEVERYQFVSSGREENSALFIGTFNHRPNVEALQWVLREVWPSVIDRLPGAKLYIAGSGSPHLLAGLVSQPGVVVLGFVEDAPALMQTKAVLISPILSGSGVRVKLLEAFASGIPVVSTRLGAEGLTARSCDYCEIADDSRGFASAMLRLFADAEAAHQMALRAREYVERERNSRKAGEALVESYSGEVRALRSGAR